MSSGMDDSVTRMMMEGIGVDDEGGIRPMRTMRMRRNTRRSVLLVLGRRLGEVFRADRQVDISFRRTG
eukprot:8047999-Pyramimonas_sp.AAC.1